MAEEQRMRVRGEAIDREESSRGRGVHDGVHDGDMGGMDEDGVGLEAVVITSCIVTEEELSEVDSLRLHGE